jgi:hypothetical protein
MVAGDLDMVLVDNFFYEKNGQGELSTQVTPHLGLLSLLNILSCKATIFDPKILFSRRRMKAADPLFYEACAEEILSHNPRIVGFTCYGRSFLFVGKMASVLKRKAKDLKIIVGGPHATMLGQQILEQYESIDIAVKFEAELTINEIVKCLFGNTSLDHIPNLIVRKEKGLLETSTASKMIDVDILKPLDYSIYFSFDNMPQALPIEVGRGCPFVCSFCSTSEFFKRKYRLRGVDFLIKELKSLKETYGISSFDLNHDLFGLNKTYLKNFCNGPAP